MVERKSLPLGLMTKTLFVIWVFGIFMSYAGGEIVAVVLLPFCSILTLVGLMMHLGARKLQPERRYPGDSVGDEPGMTAANP